MRTYDRNDRFAHPDPEVRMQVRTRELVAERRRRIRAQRPTWPLFIPGVLGSAYLIVLSLRGCA